MYIYVISLDRSEERLRDFRRVNGHLPEIERFSAADGACADRKGHVAGGTITSDLSYKIGALGCALSRIFFWEAAISQHETITICEDDAIFHSNYVRLATNVIDSSPEDWDLVMWGWNFDSILLFDLMPSVSQCLARFNQDGLRSGVEAFQRQSLDPRPFRPAQSATRVQPSVGLLE